MDTEARITIVNNDTGIIASRFLKKASDTNFEMKSL